MASVIASVLGGQPQRREASTIAEIKELLNVPNHTATLNGEPVDDDTDLSDEDFVSLAPAVKGGGATR